MRVEFTICYFAAIFAEILAVLLQILIKKKNLKVFYDEIKDSNITVFLAAMIVLNIVDFLIFDKDIIVAEYIVAAYLGALMLVWLRWLGFCVSYLKKATPARKSKNCRILFLIAMYTFAFILILASGVLNTIRAVNLPVLEPGGVIPYLVIGSWLLLAVLNVLTLWRSLEVVDEKQTDDAAVLSDERLDALAALYELTGRELAMVQYLYEGKNNAEIADILGLSENTVKTYNFRLYKKLKVENRVQAVNKIRSEIIKL